MLSLPRVKVRSLVRELRFHKLRGAAKNQTKPKKRIHLNPGHFHWASPQPVLNVTLHLLHAGDPEPPFRLRVGSTADTHSSGPRGGHSKPAAASSPAACSPSQKTLSCRCELPPICTSSLCVLTQFHPFLLFFNRILFIY